MVTGFVYVMVNDFSKFTWIIFLHSQDETFNELVALVKRVQKPAKSLAGCVKI